MANLIANLRQEAKKPKHNYSNLVGWFLADDDNSVLYAPPTRVKSAPTESTHAKSAARCPAVIATESQNFEVTCPFDLNLGLTKGPDGSAIVRNLSGEKSNIRKNKLGQKIKMAAPSEWRYKTVPILQLILPYVFVADELTYMTQTGPYMHYNNPPLPGTTFAGRFPIDVWPRQLMWAFEWHDTTKPLIIKRGTPLFYVNFETKRPDRPIKLIEAEKTSELQTYLEQMGAPTNYVNQTFSLFNRARELRPKTLLVPKK